MASKVTAVAAKLPARRRRESSGDFESSLGSAAGSAFGDAEKNPASSTTSSLIKQQNFDTLEINSAASTKGSSSFSPLSRRPFRKRAGTVDFSLSLDDEASSLKPPSIDALPPIDNLPIDNVEVSHHGTIIRGSRSQSVSLDNLDALGNEAGAAAAKIKDPDKKSRKGSFSNNSKGSDNSSSHGTMNSNSHRILLEALMGDGAEGLIDHRRERLGSFDARENARERMGSFETRERLGSFDVRERFASFDVSALTRERSGSLFRRERLESWGGMSELSVPPHPDSGQDSNPSSAAAIAAKLYTTLANDITAAANLDGNDSVSSFLVSDEVIPSKISVTRERLNSVASESSALDIMVPSETELGSDLQKFVKQAMASVGNQLADLATAVEATVEAPSEMDHESEISSTASPMIGATSDAGSKSASITGRRSRSNSNASALNISVDYDAVAAAVNAAEAAATAIDLASFTNMAPPTTASSSSSVSSLNKKRRQNRLPLQSSRSETDTQSSSKPKRPVPGPPDSTLPPIPRMDDKDMEILRERARAAAGYVPPTNTGDGTPMPAKKRAKIDPSCPHTPGLTIGTTDAHQTPRIHNSYRAHTPATPYTPALSTPGSAKSTVSKGQSSQKWDSMFDCLLEFIKERKNEETKDLSEEETKDWAWDGNVPTTFKTKDGKALGRWVNNQRSAKSKGVLKDDREKRLVDAGLKWSVLASNSWNEMLEELRVYVAEQTKAGRKWDGNVPTNYRIKTKPGAATASKDDEDKNLGRWVNRQRSLYQAGKLRKDRQQSLEKVGLKWSMLATTSWESMYDTLCDYVKSKTKDGAEWDGNVPANYRTEDNPPRALGRWINRQRSAYGKDKLKAEYIEKLNKIGLKWSVHERRPVASPDPVKSIGTSSNGGNPGIASPSEKVTSTKPTESQTTAKSSSESAAAAITTPTTLPTINEEPPEKTTAKADEEAPKSSNTISGPIPVKVPPPVAVSVGGTSNIPQVNIKVEEGLTTNSTGAATNKTEDTVTTPVIDPNPGSVSVTTNTTDKEKS